MKNILFLSVLLVSCYTKIKEPEYDFMNKIKEQAGLGPLLKTRIELQPRKYMFNKKRFGEKLTGSFYIKNVGNIDFNAAAITSNCECIKTEYETVTIKPDDSLRVNYEVDVNGQSGYITSSIVVVGNCQFGNQTYFIEGTIINK
jgi:hypothetical protein